MTKVTKLPASIEFSAKCSDMFSATFEDASGAVVADYDGWRLIF